MTTNTPTSSSNSAVLEVFGIEELLEAVLIHCTLTELARARRVCKTFDKVITKKKLKELRQQMFLWPRLPVDFTGGLPESQGRGQNFPSVNSDIPYIGSEAKSVEDRPVITINPIVKQVGKQRSREPNVVIEADGLRRLMMHGGLWKDTLVADHGPKEVLLIFNLEVFWRDTITTLALEDMVAKGEVKDHNGYGLGKLKVKIAAIDHERGVTIGDLLAAFEWADSCDWAGDLFGSRHVKMEIKDCVTEETDEI